MKKTYLVKLSYLIELDEDQGEDEEYFEQHIFNEAGEDQVLEKTNKTLEWQNAFSLQLDPSSMNCGRCDNCGQWTTDRERPDAVMELCCGATVDGRLLCDECLPKDHPWAF
ncbi:hypothetical protein QWJ34_22080 [Saccharibacillus sp. CPCC 101409]|uniref:hypothetical protein n=1 Tax=Saccharibacillus sp. CPCC 101409 TaxID=3058041 RepID=UPI002671905B|nr:hypothetical protein [Saccharibacillus sp. CPCC 101409]MDO3412469.1 hypothetical protein [Saccharibacillus sp. CPCC 101409]